MDKNFDKTRLKLAFLCDCKSTPNNYRFVPGIDFYMDIESICKDSRGKEYADFYDRYYHYVGCFLLSDFNIHYDKDRTMCIYRK